MDGNLFVEWHGKTFIPEVKKISKTLENRKIDVYVRTDAVPILRAPAKKIRS
jgi:hypothetical protein